MQDAKSLNRRYETIAWGAFFVLLGVTNLFKGLPSGAGAVGIGLILLGLNLARSSSRIPTSGFTITLGALALVLGAADLVRNLFNLPMDVPFFPLLLIVLGILLLARALRRERGQ